MDNKIVQDTEILFYNLNQIMESLRKAEKLNEFLISCNSSKTNIMRWLRIGMKPRTSSIVPICEKLGISINDIYFKKLKIEFNQKIEVKFEEPIEDALYYNVNEIYKCLLKRRKFKSVMAELKMNRSTIRRWRNKKRTPKKKSIKKICDRLGIDINDIYFKKLNIQWINEIKINFEQEDL